MANTGMRTCMPHGKWRRRFRRQPPLTPLPVRLPSSPLLPSLPECCRTKQLKVLVRKPAEQAPPPEPAPAPEGEQQPQQKGRKPPRAPAPPPANHLRGVAFDATGRYLLAGGEDKTAGVRLWDCATWELLQSM